MYSTKCQINFSEEPRGALTFVFNRDLVSKSSVSVFSSIVDNFSLHRIWSGSAWLCCSEKWVLLSSSSCLVLQWFKEECEQTINRNEKINLKRRKILHRNFKNIFLIKIMRRGRKLILKAKIISVKNTIHTWKFPRIAKISTCKSGRSQNSHIL